MLGRTLSAADEVPGAPAVAVIGENVWKRRFGSDPAIVGRSARLGGVETAVVGVLPTGFGFPVSHELWVPLRKADSDLQVFGRLSPGVRITQARAELAAIVARDRSPPPAEDARPEVVPYLRVATDDELRSAAPR